MTREDEDPRQWVGRQETAANTGPGATVGAVTALLDHRSASVVAGDVLPPLWHWLYFLPMHRQSEIGPDGHARRGGFLPPVPLPRRMWAGSQFTFVAPIRIGDRVRRTSTIDDVTRKEGRTGALVFVKVRHEVVCNGATAPALVEFDDIAYRAAAGPRHGPPPPRQAPGGRRWRRGVGGAGGLLFRYSPLTL